VNVSGFLDVCTVFHDWNYWRRSFHQTARVMFPDSGE